MSYKLLLASFLLTSACGSVTSQETVNQRQGDPSLDANPKYDNGGGNNNGTDKTPLIPSVTIKTSDGKDKISVAARSAVDFTWEAKNVSECSVSPLQLTGTSGSHKIPSVTESMIIVVDCKAGDDSVTASLVINILQPADIVASLTANNSGTTISVQKGANVNLAWTSQNAESCQVAPISASGTSGNRIVNNIQASTTFVLTCSAGNRTTEDSVTVNVGVPATLTAEIKANDSASGATVDYDTAVQISWTSAGAASCSITPSNRTGLSGTFTTAKLTQSTTYQLVCKNADDVEVRDSVSVTVRPAAAVTADIKANNSDGPISIATNTAVSIAWSSANATQCKFNGTEVVATSGTRQSANLTAAKTFTIECTGPGGTDTDAVSVNIQSNPNQTYQAEPTVANITFCNTQKLDLARPKGATGLLPALVFVHGGGWVDGDKSFFSAEIVQAATKGYVAVTINYRLTMPVFPGNIEDVKCAVRWLRANAATYNIDKNRIGIMGASAGGNLAMLAAYSDENQFKSAQFGTESSRVKAVVNWYGVSNMTEQYKTLSATKKAELAAAFGGAPGPTTQAKYDAASPVTYITADDPATQSCHGGADGFVKPAQTTTYLHPKLTSVGVANSFKIIDGYGHGFDGAGLTEARNLMFTHFNNLLK